MTSFGTTALLCLALAAPARGAFNEQAVGTSGGNFLKLAVDARGSAMGGAMGSIVDDATALHWNPAGLASLNERQIVASYVPHIEGIGYGFLAFAQPVESLVAPRRRELTPNGLGTIAVGLVYLNAGDIPEIQNDCAINANCATGGSFAPTDLALMAGWGGSFSRFIDLGLSLKLIRSQIQRAATTGAADGGVRLRLRFGQVPYTISMSAHNLLGRLRYNQQTDPLPLYYRGGMGVQLFPFLLISADAVVPRDNVPYGAVGGEFTYAYDPRIKLALRAGYNGISSEGDLDGMTGIAFGAGVRYQRLSVDYAWVPYGALGDSHRLSASLRF